MSNIVFQVQQRSKGKVSGPMTLWALIVAVSLSCIQLHTADNTVFVETALVATMFLGVYLGWQRRGGSVFIAPLVSWAFAWPPLWIAAMIHDGFVVGLFKGLFLITFGWVVIGGAEFMVLIVVSTIIRMFRSRATSQDEVVIFGPHDQPDN